MCEVVTLRCEPISLCCRRFIALRASLIVLQIHLAVIRISFIGIQRGWHSAATHAPVCRESCRKQNILLRHLKKMKTVYIHNFGRTRFSFFLVSHKTPELLKTFRPWMKPTHVEMVRLSGMLIHFPIPLQSLAAVLCSLFILPFRSVRVAFQFTHHLIVHFYIIGSIT